MMDYCWYGQTRLKQDEAIVDSVGLVCVTRERLWITAQLWGRGNKGCKSTKAVRGHLVIFCPCFPPPTFHTRCITYCKDIPFT